MSHGGRVPTSSSQQMFYQFSNSSEKEISSFPVSQPESRESRRPLGCRGPHDRPRLHPYGQGMECADCANLEHEVGPFPWTLKTKCGGMGRREGIPRENQGAITRRSQGGCWGCTTTHIAPQACGPDAAPTWEGSSCPATAEDQRCCVPE